MTMAPNKIGMNELLESEVSEGASDLHLTVGLPITFSPRAGYGILPSFASRIDS